MKRILKALFVVLAASLTVAFAQTGGATTGGADTDMAAQMDNMPEQTLQELRNLYDQLGRLIAELEGQMGVTGGEGLGEQQISSGGELENRAEALTLDESGGAMTGGAMTGGAMTGGMDEAPTLEGTIEALEGGVENLPLDAALANIEGWQTTLSDAGLTDLADELGQLATALQADPVDQDEVSGLLLSLGAQTTAAADNATDEDTSSQLARLGAFLTELGSGAGVTGGNN